MNYKEQTLTTKDNYTLSIRIYKAQKPKAVIKIIHGMEEHQARYEDFATFLQNNGYTVVTADLRGHGKNAPKLSHIADKNGHELLLSDELEINAYIKEKYPKLPLMLFSHSMGTLVARKVLEENSSTYAKVVLCGYPNPTAAADAGVALSALLRSFKGAEGHSQTLTKLVLGPFVKAIKDSKSPLDWLSYNEDNLNTYMHDPLCGAEFTIGSYNALFHLVSEIGDERNYENVNKNLPLLLISGADDPVTGGEKGREKSLNVLQKVGFTNIEVKTLDHMRHEILNETNKQEAYDSILQFFNK